MKIYNYIYMQILNANEDTNNLMYNSVLGELEREINNEKIFNYVLRCAIYNCTQKDKRMTFKQILDVMNSEFCLIKAYEYLEFLRNNHEHLDEIEGLKR